MDLANGTGALFGYDENGRIDDITHWANIGGYGPSLMEIQYGYDAAGNCTFTRRQGGPEDRSERYGYDNLNRLTVMDRGVLNTSGTAVTAPLSHPVLNSNQQWAELDRRGNWLDYRWTITSGEDPNNYASYRQTRTANKVNAYEEIDPDGPGDPPSLPSVTPGYDMAGNLKFDPLAPNVGASAPAGQCDRVTNHSSPWWLYCGSAAQYPAGSCASGLYNS